MAYLQFPSPTQLRNISAPDSASDAATKAYVDAQMSGATIGASGSNTQVQFNDNGSFAGNASLTFNKTTGVLTVAHIAGEGANLTGVNALTLNGHNDTYFASTTYVDTAITNLINGAPGILDTLSEIANAIGNDASFITTINNKFANKLDSSAFSSTANTWLSTQTTSNLSEGTNLYYTDVRANTAIDARVTKSFVDNLGVVANIANVAYSVSGSNVSGQVSNALVAGTVYTNAQPNITSVGTLTSLSVTGNLTTGNITGGNLVTANYISGNGSLLTSLTGANVTGFVANANVANVAYSVSGSNVTGQVGNSLIASFVYTNAQPNITSVGTLTSLTVSGLTDLGTIGNIKITGGSNNYVLSTDGAGNLAWQAPGGSGTLTADVDSLTGDGSTTTFTLATTPTGENYTIVAVQGVLQPKSSYSITGNSIIFSSPPPNTAVIEVTTFGGSVVAGGGSSFTWNIATSNITLTSNNGYFADTSGGAKTLTLPSAPTLGDTIRINDLAGTFTANNLTVSGNSNKIQGSTDDLLIDYDQASVTLVYSNSTYGWKILES